MSSKSPPHDSTYPPIEPSFDDETELLLALGHAHAPEELSTLRHEAILAQALGFALETPIEKDEFETASPHEREQASLLAQALDGHGEHPLASIAALLSAVYAPTTLSQLTLERTIRTAVASRARLETTSVPSARLRNRVIGATGAGVVLALAATFALLWYPQTARNAELARSVPAELTLSRSLAPLFTEGFSHGRPTERMDRIVMARSRDLRHNRYLEWRVR